MSITGKHRALLSEATAKKANKIGHNDDGSDENVNESFCTLNDWLVDINFYLNFIILMA